MVEWLTQVRGAVMRWPHRLLEAVMARLPLAAIEWLATAGWSIRYLFDSSTRWHGIMRREIARDMLALTDAACNDRRIATSEAREDLLDRHMHAGLLRRQAWPDLYAVAVRLAAEVRRLRARDPDRPVIVSPFHYVSEYANIYVADQVRACLGLKSIAVVSGTPRDLYGDDHDAVPHVEILYTYGEEDRIGLGRRLARALKRDGVAVLFADAPPFAMHRFPMQTVGVSMFGRGARIHNGVFRLGALVNAWLLPFYLRVERGRFGGELFEPLPLADAGAPQQLAGYIETALTDNFPDSILAVHPSMYAFAPAR